MKSMISDDEEAEPSAAPAIPPPPSIAPAPPPAPSEAAPKETVSDESIPAVVDFEEDAFERVTKESVKVRVDDLAREIKGN
jgi:hypothetical protein